MRIARSFIALSIAALAAAGGPPAFAQRALVDYESSAKATEVRDAAEWRLAFRPSLQVLRQTVAQLRAGPPPSAEVAARVDAILKMSGFDSEADERKALTEAATLLRGKAWSPGQQSLEALGLKISTPVFGGAREVVSVNALYSAPSAAGARYRIDLYQSAPTTSATPRKGALVKTVAEGQLSGVGTQTIPLDLASAADGSYLLIATFSLGSETGSPSAQSIYVIHELPARHATLMRELAPINGHEQAKATAEYPFVLAEALQAGNREIVSYDFPKAMTRSAEIAKDLKARHDPIERATGLQNRAYRFAEAGELVPYQLYVPSGWSPERQWPLVVALHGANLDETNMLGRAGGEMQKLAEQYGFVVVAPLGYKLNSGYGSLRMPKALLPEELRRRQLSEADVLAVSALVEREYRIDPRRRYLTGNSMGGGGTWWIGGHYPERWAAIAPAAYGGVLPEDVAALKKVPVLAVVGDHDELGMLDQVRASVATLRAGGAEPSYVEVKGGTHAGAFDAAMPDIFKFFSEHTR
jgi:poly(3-hydroxybutyrate) depolymerase